MADSKQDPIRYLIERRFPAGPIARAVRDERKSLRPLTPAIKDSISQAIAYRTELSKLSESELAARYDKEKKKETAELLARARAEEQKLIFHQPYANADFKHWAKAAHWTLDEAIALSFGRGPEDVSWGVVKPFLRVSPFAYQYNRRRDLALRAVSWKQLFDPVLPGIFLAWAKKLDLDVPPELEAEVAAVGVQMTDWKPLYDDLKVTFEELQATYSEHHEKWMALSQEQRTQIDRLLARIEELQAALATTPPPTSAREKALGTRERESLLKLVIGMAVGGYGYDPTDARSEHPTEVASDLDSSGVHLDVDTVRKWLKVAADLLPPESHD